MTMIGNEGGIGENRRSVRVKKNKQEVEKD